MQFFFLQLFAPDLPSNRNSLLPTLKRWFRITWENPQSDTVDLTITKRFMVYSLVALGSHSPTREVGLKNSTVDKALPEKVGTSEETGQGRNRSNR